MEIKILTKNCKFKPIASFKAFQGDLKSISKESMQKLKASILRNGFNAPVFIWNGFILDGHQRLAAIKELIAEGHMIKGIPYVEIEAKNKKQAAEMVLTYNSQYGELNGLTSFIETFDLNVEELGEITNLNIDLDNLMGEQELKDVEPEDPQKIDTDIKTGDIFQLGAHRVMCGDSTKEDDVKKLMGGGLADMVLTDPPYNVDYSEKNKFLNAISPGNRIQTPIQNDNIPDFRAFLVSFLSVIPLADYNTVYLFTSGKEISNVILSFKEAGYYYSQDLKWIKNNHVLGRLDYAPKSENIIYGWKGKHKFYADFAVDVLEFDKPTKSDLHPTMKPIELLSKLLADGSQKGAIIYDGFGGSGSTLIACEQLNRKCYMMEIDPIYCQVIINRWEKLTSKKAVKIT